MLTMLDFLKKLFSTPKPNAAKAWQAAGNEAANAYWLYAAPVHLVLQRDSFSLAAPAPLMLGKDEIDALTDSLNKHFEADIVENKATFFWHENIWFLRLEHHPQIESYSPELAMNKDVGAFLPTGEGAIKWAQFTNEIQMLLFEHPINQTREAKRLPAINSIWCYGGGQLESQAN
jgi:hypothetical protein